MWFMFMRSDYAGNIEGEVMNGLAELILGKPSLRK